GAMQGETRIGPDESLGRVSRLQAVKVGGAQAARQPAHADFQVSVLGARGQRVIARHACARRYDAYQITRREARQAAPAQAIAPARTWPAKAQDRRGPVRLAWVVLTRYQRERSAWRHARHIVQHQRLIERLRHGFAPARELLAGLLVDAFERQQRRPAPCAKSLLQRLGKGAKGRVLPVAKS